MLLGVQKPSDSLASSFALTGVRQDEAVCKNRLFFTFCLRLMNLFRGRWRTGLYTLFKYCMCWRNTNSTKHGPGHWTNKADLQGGIRCAHKQQRGRRRLAAILSFPLLKTTPLYPSTHTGIQITFAYFSTSECLLCAELRWQGLKVEQDYWEWCRYEFSWEHLCLHFCFHQLWSLQFCGSVVDVCIECNVNLSVFKTDPTSADKPQHLTA